MKVWFWGTFRPRLRLRRPAVAETVTATGKTSDWCRERLGLALDDWQVRFLDAPQKRKVLVGARQCGKSTVGAALAMARMVAKAGCRPVFGGVSGRRKT